MVATWTDLSGDPAGTGEDRMTREDKLIAMRDNMLVASEHPFTLQFGRSSQDVPQNADPTGTNSDSFVFLEDWELWIPPSEIGGTKLVLAFVAWTNGAGFIPEIKMILNEGTPVEVVNLITDVHASRQRPGDIWEWTFTAAQIDAYRGTFVTIECWARHTHTAGGVLVFIDEPSLPVSRFEEE